MIRQGQTPGNRPGRKTRILLADDHAIWRGGVAAILADTEFEIVGETSSGAEAIEAARRLKPAMTLLDIRMPGGDGLEALVVLKREQPTMAVIMLTTYDNPTFMAQAVAGGAAGYLLKGVDYPTFVEALRAVSRGDTLLSASELVRSLRSVSDNAAGAAELVTPLTERENEVLRLLSTGLNNREIGQTIFIAESTVKTHVEHIIDKLGVSDRVQAAVWAARCGVLARHGAGGGTG
ncbi:MAG: response regulator transcription factor [Armatimonadetes bacterium]|nr:response regulator transcription factor [Armatimonadota bacterium]MDE2206433.1 response regulator transcription factor [Armatimonadota bacterium]